MDVIITLAGKSQRFKDAGYSKPKYLLPLGNSFVLEQVLNQFDDNDNFHLVYSVSQSKQICNIEKKLNSLKKKTQIYKIQDHNYGPVYSALKVDNIDINSEVIISYCDFLVSWDYKKFKRICSGYDSSIVSFRGFHPSSFSGTLYCYLKTRDNLVTNIREKKSFTNKPYLEYAATGIHYFNTYSLFKNTAYKIMNSKRIKKKYKEYYVSLPYAEIIKEKKTVLNFPVENFISLGTPRDYEEFVYWKNYFKND